MVNMKHKVFLRLLVLFLGFSYVVFSAAVPTSRSLKSIKSVSAHQGVLDIRKDGEVVEVGHEYIKGRTDWESTDYPGTGANNHHDPKTPGRA